MTRRLPVVLVALGTVVLLAVVVATIITRSSDTASLALPERPETAAVVTEPGVLSAVDTSVTARAVADAEEPVVMAVGRTAEVEAWLGDAEHLRVVGLSSWEELSVEVASPEPATEESTEAETGTESATEEPTAEPAALPDPAGSDLWVEEAVGVGEAELAWVDRPGQWSLVVATDGTGAAPMVELEWGRESSTPWLVPGVVVGVLLLVAGGAMLVLDGLARREQRRRDEDRARQRTDPTTDVTSASGLGAGAAASADPDTGQRLSRREIRELERAVAQAERRRRRGEEDDVPVPPVGAGDTTDDESPDTAPAATDDTPGEAQQDAAATAPDVLPNADPAEPTTTPPSWRSVWGFGAAAPRDGGTARDDETRDDDDGKGAR